MTKSLEKPVITAEILAEYIESLLMEAEVMLEEDPDDYNMELNLACVEEIKKNFFYRVPTVCTVNSICPECKGIFPVALMNTPAHYCPMCGQHVTKKTKP